MPRSIRRYLALSGIALFGALAGPVAAAQASDATLRATINSAGPKIVSDEAAVAKGLAGYKHHKVKPLVRALNHEVNDLHALVHTLRGETASSTKGRKAKKDIVKGLGLIATAYAALSQDVNASHGNGVPPAQVNAAVSTDKRGRAILKTGLKLLAAT